MKALRPIYDAVSSGAKRTTCFAAEGRVYCILKVSCARKPLRLADSDVVVPMLPKVKPAMGEKDMRPEVHS